MTDDPDRAFWIAIRRALLLIVRAIEVWKKLGDYNSSEDVVNNPK